MADKTETTAYFQYHYQTKYHDQIKNFLHEYQFEDIIYPSYPNHKYLKKAQDRVCRFCGRPYGKTTFKKDAHLIPELLGNKWLFSDFECDECNHYFGTIYEDNFSKMLGMYRTINKVSGKESFPTFKSPGEQIIARVKQIDEKKAVIISRENACNEAIIVEEENAKIIINYKKNSYIPVLAYKALLKIALSIINTHEVQQDYEYALNYLLNKNDIILNGCFVMGYSLPFYFGMLPHIILYKKRNPNTKTHTHVIALYFQNLIYILPVPLNQKDFFFYGEEISMRICPPLFLINSNLENTTIKPFTLDLSSREKLKGEEDTLIIEMNKEDFSKRQAFNLKTRKTDLNAVFDSKSITKIIISDILNSIDLNIASNLNL